MTGVCGTLGFISLGFLADLIGRRAVTMLFYLMCLVLTPVVYLWAKNIDLLLVCVGVFGFLRWELGLGANLAARAVSDPDAWHCDRIFV